MIAALTFVAGVAAGAIIAVVLVLVWIFHKVGGGDE